MLQGIRWQILALIISAAVFVAVLLTRDSGSASDNNTPPETSTSELAPSPTQTAESDIVDATAEPTGLPAAPVGDLKAMAGSATDDVTTYREGILGRVQRLNPVFANLNPVDTDITSLIFEGLTAIDDYGQVIPLLATGWVVSFDGLEYVFTLRGDVLWQDGVPFTADDVVYTMSILGDPAFPGDPATGAFWRTVETQKISDTMVRFRLTQPLASFPEALRIGLLPHHALQGTDAAQLASHPINFRPIGTGPYQLEALRGSDGHIQQVDLRVSPNYRQRPEGQTGYALERVSFRLFTTFDDLTAALRAEEIDAYATQYHYMQALLNTLGGQYTNYTTFEPSIGFVVFNWEKEDNPVFKEEPVRQALITGANYGEIVSRNMMNMAVPANSPIPPLSWAYDGSLSLPAYDPNVARDLLSRAVIDPEESDVLFNVSIMVLEDPVLPEVVRQIAAQWSELSIEKDGATLRVVADVEVVEGDEYRARLENGDFDAAIVEYSRAPSADPDVYAFWHQGQYPDGLNYGGANDRRVSEALERARRDANGTNRVIHYKDFQRLFIERAIAIPLYYPLMTYYVDPAVDGIQLGFIGARTDRFRTIQDWSFAG